MPIGRWVLKEACRQVQNWIEAGLNAAPVAVNVSSLEFRSDGFLENVKAVLKDTNLNPDYLELELTETVLMQHAESSDSVLAGLKSIGVRLAVDDFGTGYSSLSYLKRFPIDFLKIDQSFMRDIASRTDDAPIITAVITMARSLRHRVVGEGVETEEQTVFLQTHGCDEAQGFYFSQPLVAEDLAKLLNTRIVLVPPMATKTSTTLPGIVDKIIESPLTNQPDKAQISVEGAEPNYRELRIKNNLTDENGVETPLKTGTKVEVTVEANLQP